MVGWGRFLRIVQRSTAPELRPKASRNLGSPTLKVLMAVYTISAKTASSTVWDEESFSSFSLKAAASKDSTFCCVMIVIVYPTTLRRR